jgi:hypothetical protein
LTHTAVTFSGSYAWSEHARSIDLLRAAALRQKTPQNSAFKCRLIWSYIDVKGNFAVLFSLEIEMSRYVRQFLRDLVAAQTVDLIALPLAMALAFKSDGGDSDSNT